MKRTNWFDRKFPPIEDNGLLPSIIERLAGTAARIEAIAGDLNLSILEFKPDNKWSIKEEIGHLLDLEPLWLGRVSDLESKTTELRATDLTNQQTHNANHNSTDISLLTTNFRKQRQKFVTKLRNLSDEKLFHSSAHPRLKTPMRIIDLTYFVAEHDDHHLARISEILFTNAQFSEKNQRDK